MVVGRIHQIKSRIQNNKEATISALQVYLDEKDIDDLCLFLDHFDPQLLDDFKSENKYKDIMVTVSKAYVEPNRKTDPRTLWGFLEKFDRNITAAQIRIQHRPIDEEFSFLIDLDEFELLNLLNMITHEELICILSYAPRKVREIYFGQISSKDAFTITNTIESLQRISDDRIRHIANKLRGIHHDHSHELKTVAIDKEQIYGDVINSLKDNHRQDFINHILAQDPNIVNYLAGHIFLDESIRMLPNPILTDTFLALTPEESAAYLGQFIWGSEILQQLNPRLKEHIQEFQTPQILQDQSLVDRAKRKIKVFLQNKNRFQHLNLKEINEKILKN